MSRLLTQELSDSGLQGPPSARHMPELDGLRGIAIITVVWHNVSAGGYGDSGIFGDIVNVMVNAGWVGVQLFFVLSGFLITGLLIDEKHQPQHLRNFFMRRVLRIFPLYYLVLAISFLVVPVTGWGQYWIEGYREHQIWYWVYLANWVSVAGDSVPGFQHFWSLAVEEQYYLLWPACVLLLGSRGLLRLCLALIVSALAFRYAVSALAPAIAHKAAYQFTCARWDALAIGAVCAIATRQAGLREWLPALSRSAIALALVYVLVDVAMYHNFEPTGPGLGSLNQSFCAIGFGGWLLVSIGGARTGVGRCNQRLLNLGWLRLVGKYSYAIYVFHFPVKIITEPLWQAYSAPLSAEGGMVSASVHAIVIFVIAYMLALISWQLVEKPLLGLKKYFYVRPRAAAAC